METITITVADLDADEQALIKRRDAYVQEANANINAFNGAIQQVQYQRARLLEKQKEQEKAQRKPRRGKVAKKEVTTPEAETIEA